MRRLPMVWFLAAASLCCGQDPFERVLQLSRIRHKMADALNHMPDYTCLGTTERAQQRPRDRGLKLVDTIRYEIAHTGDKELWAWPGAASFEDTPITSMVQSGSFGFGDFVLHARSVFVGGYANMKFAGPEQVDGRPALRWDYDVPKFGSGWQIQAVQSYAVAAMTGSFWVDSETLDVLRLEIHAAELPSDFPIIEVINTINYARTKTGASFIQLPQSAVLVVRERNGELRQNTTEFSHCRQYSGQSTISFDTNPTDKVAVAETATIQEIALPAGLRFRIKLLSAIDSKKAAVGDLLEGIVEDDVFQKKNLIVPKGAHVTGRIRRVEKQSDGSYFTVGIELDDITYPGHHARFFGSLNGVEPEPTGLQWYLGSYRKDTRGVGVISTTIAGSVHLPDLPGVGTFFILGSSFRIPHGTILIWETKSL
jgi:hypothetical protein